MRTLLSSPRSQGCLQDPVFARLGRRLPNGLKCWGSRPIGAFAQAPVPLQGSRRQPIAIDLKSCSSRCQPYGSLRHITVELSPRRSTGFSQRIFHVSLCTKRYFNASSLSAFLAGRVALLDPNGLRHAHTGGLELPTSTHLRPLGGPRKAPLGSVVLIAHPSATSKSRKPE